MLVVARLQLRRARLFVDGVFWAHIVQGTSYADEKTVFACRQPKVEAMKREEEPQLGGLR